MNVLQARTLGRQKAIHDSAALRILHVYAGNLYGGIETLLVTLARLGAREPGFQHDYALCFEARLSAELRTAGATVHLLGPARVSRPWTVWRARRNLADLLRRENFDLAICHSCWPHALFGRVVRRAGVPLVFWAHEALTGQHWLERWARRTPPQLALANSRYTAASLPAIFGQVPVEVCYCPVLPPAAPARLTPRADLRTQLGTPADAVVVLQISRLERLKGQHVLLDALARLKHRPEWNCWIVGSPQRPHEVHYWEALQAVAHDNGLTERVRFLGHRADIHDLLAAADIYCQPNVGPDSFGLTFVEALYAGRVVVTSALGGAREIVDDSCGFLLPPGDVAILAATLEALLLDTQRRERLGRAGPERARRLCDPTQTYRQLGESLRRVVGARSG